MDDTNQFGTIAESRTHTKLVELGFIVLVSRNERLPWDRGITHYNNTKKFIRLQIKGSRSVMKKGNSIKHQVWTSKGKAFCKSLYTKDEIDFFVIHLESEDGQLDWYVIPVDKVLSTRVYFYPRMENSKGKYEKYKDAWHLLERKFKA